MVALKEKKIGKNNLELKTQIFDMEKTVVTAADSEVRGKLMVFQQFIFANDPINFSKKCPLSYILVHCASEFQKRVNFNNLYKIMILTQLLFLNSKGTS